MAYVARLKKKYNEEVAPAMMQKFQYKSVMQIPRIDKIVVSVGCGDCKDNAKMLEAVIKDISEITGQKAVATKHQKPRKQGEEGGIIKVETPIYVSKVQLVCPKCGKATRVGYKVENSKKTRVCKKCGAEV